jgi:glycosyltransferase involved in cell wall biosynthesis
MKVLHLITELELGGAERLLVTMLPRLDRKRFEVSVAYLYGEAPLRPELERAGIRVTKLDSQSKCDLRAFSRLVQLLREERVEILHTHLIQADLMGYFAARRARVPVMISTKHNTHYFRSHASWLARLDAFVNRRLTRVVAVSDAVKDFYIRTQQLAADRIEVIHNGIDLERFRDAKPLARSALGCTDSERIVCAVGSLTEKKGHSVLLRAWSEVVRAQAAARLLLVGDGPLRGELERRVGELGLKDMVRFLGRRQDVPEILRASDLFVLPSLWEGFGIVVVEAMAAGLPVIASNVDGVGEIVRPEQDGLLVSPGDPAGLAQAVLRVLNDRQFAQQLAGAGAERAARFSIMASAEALQRLYATLPTRSSPSQDAK